MPGNTIYVGRGSKWGNPFICDDPQNAVDAYKAWLVYANNIVYPGMDAKHIAEIYGCELNQKWARMDLGSSPIEIEMIRDKNFACWCQLDKPCHADILLELANKG